MALLTDAFLKPRNATHRQYEALRAYLVEVPPSAWRRIELEGIARAYRTPRILDERIGLGDYDGPLRQLTITDLGHEQPTLLITNQLKRSPAKLTGRYAPRCPPRSHTRSTCSA